MSIRAVPLTGEIWESMEPTCRSCLFWEFGERPGGDVERDLVRKQAWTTARLREGMTAGSAVLVDDEVAGFALFARPDTFALHPGGLPTTSHDALAIGTIWVDPAHRGVGVGRRLVQAAIKTAMKLRLGAVEVRADRRWVPDNCVLPITWLLHEGFEVAVEHVRWPVLRLEVARTVRWAESVEQAVEGVRGLLPRPVTAPRPAVDAVAEGRTIDA